MQTLVEILCLQWFISLHWGRGGEQHMVFTFLKGLFFSNLKWSVGSDLQEGKGVALR